MNLSLAATEIVSKKELKEKYGRTAFDLNVLRRFVSEEEMKKLVEVYDKHMIRDKRSPKISLYVPNENDLQLVKNIGKSIVEGQKFVEVARSLGMSDTKLMYRIFKIGLYELGIKPHLPSEGGQ